MKWHCEQTELERYCTILGSLPCGMDIITNRIPHLK